MTNPDILISGAQLPNGDRKDVLISGGIISDIFDKPHTSTAQIINAEGLVLLPGFVDLHTHLREPGFEESETILSGTQAAARGGFTAVFPMANTHPVADSAGTVELVQRRGDQAGYATVQPIGAVTEGLNGTQLAQIGAMATSQAKVRVFSDDGKCVYDAQLMKHALEYVKAFNGVIAQHAQEPRLTEHAQMNDGEVSSRLGLTGWPSVAEESIIARDVLLAEHTQSRLHVCHVSTAGSVDIIRWAKNRGISVTAEVTPHHLLLTEENVVGYDARYKVNPPLRRHEDVIALREALADGTIDIVATDHAPHPPESKECEWSSAAFGMVGLESAFAVLYTTMVSTGLLSWDDLSRVMSHAPARIGGLEAHGLSIEVGNPAELTLVDPSMTKNFSTTDLASKSSNSPYLGLELLGDVVATIHHGYLTLENSTLVDQSDVASAARKYTYE